MMYDSLLSRSFSKQQKNLGYGGLLLFSFLFFFNFCSVFMPFLASFALYNDINNEEVKVGITDEKNVVVLTNKIHYHQLPLNESCKKQERSDSCEVKGDIRINGNQSTVFIVSSEQTLNSPENNPWPIRPYARKGDQGAMNKVRQWSLQLISNIDVPKCSKLHRIPAILFSLGGYSGNHFHSFSDIILPLYPASRGFNSQVLFLVTNYNSRWVNKFKNILKGLSKYEIIDIDRNIHEIHCFKSVAVGLQRLTRKELTVETSRNPNAMKDFREFLRSSYSLKKVTEIEEKPKLVIVSRKRSRAFTNVDLVAKMAEILGFGVVVFEPDGDMERTAEIMNSCDVVLGVHGAGLTNIVFLHENGVLIQVVPFGGAEWVSKEYFEEPSKGMNLRYLEYRISVNESSLVQDYPYDHVVLRSPGVVQKQGWRAFKEIYFDKQNVEIDLIRFKPTLLRALELLRQSIGK